MIFSQYFRPIFSHVKMRIFTQLQRSIKFLSAHFRPMPIRPIFEFGTGVRYTHFTLPPFLRICILAWVRESGDSRTHAKQNRPIYPKKQTVGTSFMKNSYRRYQICWIRYYFRWRFTTAGTPATSTSSGTSRVTTLPAATITLLPIVTPGHTVTLPPSQQSSPMVIG